MQAFKTDKQVYMYLKAQARVQFIYWVNTNLPPKRTT